MKGFWKDFKAFLQRGNVVDLAVAVVVGGAFGKIVTSLVNDIIMPLISLAIGGASVSDWKWVIQEATYDSNGVLLTAETALHYGAFIQTILDFLIIAFFIFLAIRIVTKLATASSKGVADLKTKAVKTLHIKGKGKGGAEVVENAEDAKNAENAENAIQTAEVASAVAGAGVNANEETQKLLTEIRDLLKGKLEKQEDKDTKED